MRHTYNIGDKVVLITKKRGVTAKLSQPDEGPYEILDVHKNGTVKIRRGLYDENINIHRLKPYQEKD